MTKNAYKLNFVAKPLFAPFRHRFHIEFGIKYHAFCTFSHSSSMFRGLMSPNFTIFHSFSIGLQFKGSNNGTWFPESKTSLYPVFESLCRVLEIQFSVLRISNTNFSITTYLLLYYIYFRLIGAKALILLFTFSSAVQLICAETKAIRLFPYLLSTLELSGTNSFSFRKYSFLKSDAQQISKKFLYPILLR